VEKSTIFKKISGLDGPTTSALTNLSSDFCTFEFQNDPLIHPSKKEISYLDASRTSLIIIFFRTVVKYSLRLIL